MTGNELIELFALSLLALAVIRLLVFVFVGDWQTGPAICSLKRRLDGSSRIGDGTAKRPSRQSGYSLPSNGASNIEHPAKPWGGAI